MESYLLEEIQRAAAECPQFGPTSFPKTVPGSVMDLDGDYLAYYCGTKESPGLARMEALDRIERMRLMSGAESVLMHLSAAGCTKGHRFVIATVKKYQGQRKGAKPVNWRYLREVFETFEGSAFTPKIWLNREADDGIAYCSKRPNRVIATRDKDMQMLPGLHISWTTHELIRVNPGDWEVLDSEGTVYGLKWFYLQLLQGDGADNIPGIPRLFGAKCADKTAAKYLAGTTGPEDAYELIKAAYKGFYREGWSDALAEQAALLWLRTDAKAEIANFLEGFPPCDELSAAADRLVARVHATLAEFTV